MEEGKRIELEGLSRYWLTLDKEGGLHVWSKRLKREMKARLPPAAKTPRYGMLIDGSTKPEWVSFGLLMYLVKNPTISKETLRNRKRIRAQRILFNKAGDPVSYQEIHKDSAHHRDIFRGIDDALEMLQFLKEVKESGEHWRLYEYAESRKRDVMKALAHKIGYIRLNSLWEEAKMQFMDDCLNLNVRRITPLFHKLCCSMQKVSGEEGKKRKLSPTVSRKKL